MSVCRGCPAPMPLGDLMCAKCGAWSDGGLGAIAAVTKAQTMTLDQVGAAVVERIVTDTPLDAALGGGIVPTSVVLFGDRLVPENRV